MEIIKDGALYQFAGLSVAPAPPMELLAKWYFEALEDGTMEAFYYESVPNLEVFMQTCRKAGTVMLGGFVKGPAKHKMVSLGCVNEIIPMGAGFHRVEIGMACLRAHQHRSVTLPLATMMMTWVFDNTKADFVFGSTPEPNRAMLRFLKALGMKCCKEPIPHTTTFKGKVCGTYISHLSKTDWPASQAILNSSHVLRHGEIPVYTTEPCLAAVSDWLDTEHGSPRQSGAGTGASPASDPVL